MKPRDSGVPEQPPLSGRPARSRRDVDDSVALDPTRRELEAESITVRIRWFGLCVGYLYVNLVDRSEGQPALNAMLTLGAVYALLDTLVSLRGKILLADYRLGISVMEALFIGLLCYFDYGVGSPFRFYYFLSLLVCAIRHSPRLTFATFGLHSLSYIILGLIAADRTSSADAATVILTLVFLGWTAWAVIALTGLLKSAGQRLRDLNDELQKNQRLLEERIAQRTEELQESQAMLVQQEKQAAFGLLAAGIAHEVGNPLASISSIVQLLSRRNEDPHITERLKMVDDQLIRIQRTLRELMGFSRPTNQQVTAVDIHAAINDALNIAKYYKRRKGKIIETTFDSTIPAVRTVYDQLVQVLLNLILNAMDATEEGRSIFISTERIESHSAADVGIRVRDEGHGIPPDARQRIFQAYYTTKAHGTGLGLFVCRQIVRNELGGDIQLVASTDSGTEFLVTIPLRTAETEDAPRAALTP